jgi:hypothetical protein
MAEFFKVLEAEGGGGGPEWLSDHPNPGNRYQRIDQEARALGVQGDRVAVTNNEFTRVQARLKGMSPALTAAQIAQNQKNGNINNGPAGTTGRAVNVEPPSGSYRTYQPSNALRVAVPANWQQVASANNSITYAPQGAYFQGNGTSAFTHGIEVGITQGTGNLQRDTNSLLRNFAQGNPNLRQQGNSKDDSVGGRSAITVPLANVSEVTGQPEYISLSTAQLRDGSLLYVIGVAPRTEASTYDNTFKKIRQNLQITDR